MAIVASYNTSLPPSLFRLPASEATKYPSAGRPNCGPPLLACGQWLPHSAGTPSTQYACLGWGACPGLLHTTGRGRFWWIGAHVVSLFCHALEHGVPFWQQAVYQGIAELCVCMFLMGSLCYFSRVAITSLWACPAPSQIPSFLIVPSEGYR